MLVGYPPFYDDNPFGIYEKILSGKIDWPRQMDPVAKDLVKKLLVPDRTKRLGNMKNGGEDIRRHRWFKNLDWDDVYKRKLTVRRHEIKVIFTKQTKKSKKHYKSIHWKVYNIKQTISIFTQKPPIIPKVSFEGDTSNFDDYPETDWQSARSLENKELQLFEDFWP